MTSSERRTGKSAPGPLLLCFYKHYHVHLPQFTQKVAKHLHCCAFTILVMNRKCNDSQISQFLYKDKQDTHDLENQITYKSQYDYFQSH